MERLKTFTGTFARWTLANANLDRYWGKHRKSGNRIFPEERASRWGSFLYLLMGAMFQTHFSYLRNNILKY